MIPTPPVHTTSGRVTSCSESCHWVRNAPAGRDRALPPGPRPWLGQDVALGGRQGRIQRVRTAGWWAGQSKVVLGHRQQLVKGGMRDMRGY